MSPLQAVLDDGGWVVVVVMMVGVNPSEAMQGRERADMHACMQQQHQQQQQQ